ncbi:DAK2 domain-containing protein [Paenibacillus sp. CMAA1364]
MNVQFIDSEKIYFGFLSGANAVIKQRNELNKINVFPVADGDTGTNLAFTMVSIIEEARVKESAKKTMESIAEAALIGARGNSGIIFASFINGLYMGLDDKKDISIKGFSSSVKSAVNYAYKSISNPVEGTMITVMRDWSDALDMMKDRANDFTELLTKSLEVALQSLKRTPELLQVLKDASVVDSGAKGFVHFLEGFAHFMRTKQVDQTTYHFDDIEMVVDEVHHIENPDVNHRYCTEALVLGEHLDLDDMRNALKDSGESLIITGNSHKARIHIHTRAPQDIFDRLRGFGQIIQQKADDMIRQYESTHARKYNIALVTDSIADLPKALMDQYQIHMIPLNLIVDDSIYLDKMTISPSYLYQSMNESKNYPTSSQPTLRDTENFLNQVSSNYESVIVVTVSKLMSGTHSSILQVAEKLNAKGKRIAVIDSKLNSGAQGLVVLKAAEEIAAGKEMDEVIQSIETTIAATKIFVSVDNLKYMVRSGRVEKIQGSAAKVLNLKPIVSIDDQGKGMIMGATLSLKATMRKMKLLVQEISRTKNIVSYSIVHADAIERATELEKVVTQITGKSPIYTTDISSIVAMNAGIGCVAIALTTE